MLFRSGLGVGHSATHGAGVVTSRESEEGAGRLSGCVCVAFGRVRGKEQLICVKATDTNTARS